MYSRPEMLSQSVLKYKAKESKDTSYLKWIFKKTQRQMGAYLVDSLRITLSFRAKFPILIGCYCFQACKRNACRERVLICIQLDKILLANSEALKTLAPGTVSASSKRRCMFLIVTCALLITFSITFSTAPRCWASMEDSDMKTSDASRDNRHTLLLLSLELKRCLDLFEFIKSG